MLRCEVNRISRHKFKLKIEVETCPCNNFSISFKNVDLENSPDFYQDLKDGKDSSLTFGDNHLKVEGNKLTIFRAARNYDSDYEVEKLGHTKFTVLMSESMRKSLLEMMESISKYYTPEW